MSSFAKRFYKQVTVEARDGGFVVLLDGRVLKTPKKQPLIIDTEARAQLVAAEWDAQVDEINPSLMPCTRMMNVACEQTPTRRDDLIAEARRYAGTDLLCYRAASPSDLTARQEEKWNPLLEWAGQLGIKLKSVTGIIAVEQDKDALDAVADQARALGDVDLTLLVHFISVCGSAVLGLAVMKGHLSAGQALDLSRLDELYQIEQWGEDEEAAERTAFIRTETLALAALI